jgi:hypothetical protein
MSQCAAIKPSGERCKAQAMSSDQWCYTHSPATADARARSTRKGGLTGGRGRPKTTLARIHEAHDFIDNQLRQLLEGVTAPRISAVAGKWANSKLKAIELEYKLLEHEQAKEELAELKQSIDDQRGDEGRRWR